MALSREKLPLDISYYKLEQAPRTLYYIPNFISSDEEDYLLRQVYASPKPKWTQLSNRRLQNWGGLPHEKGMISEQIPQWLNIYCERISELDLFEGKKANHVLVNEYLPGQGIMPHEDGNLFYPTVTTITLGSHTVENFYYHRGTEGSTGDVGQQMQDSQSATDSLFMCSALLERRSLVAVKDDMYKIHLHGIEERTQDHINDNICNIGKCDNVALGDVLERGTRISLTIRHVPKVLKTKLFMSKR